MYRNCLLNFESILLFIRLAWGQGESCLSSKEKERFM